MRWPSSDSDQGVRQDNRNLFADVARAVIHSESSILVAKLFETAQLVEAWHEDQANIFQENLDIHVGLFPSLSKLSLAESHTTFL
jgi:hypothetical protein